MASLGGSAWAQSSTDVARSNALFDDGKRLLKEGKVREACIAFEESYRLAQRAGTLLNLGLCHEQEGKLLTARRELVEARALAQSQNNTARVSLASEHLTAIDAKLSWIELLPPPNVKEELVTLTVDGVALERTAWRAIPVEAGRHIASAAASGFARRDIEVVVGQTPERRIVRFEPLAPLDGAPPGTPGSVDRRDPMGAPPGATHGTYGAPGGQGAPAGDGVAPDKGLSTLRTAALITGIAGVAVSLGTGIFALERKGVVRSHCDANKACDPDGLDAASTGRALVITSTVAFAVGAVGFGAWLVLPDGPPQTGAGPSRATGIAVGGVF